MGAVRRLTGRSQQAGVGGFDAGVTLWFAALALVVGSTIAYGGVTPAARAGLELSSVLLAAAIVFRVAQQRSVPADALRLSVPLGLMMGLAAVQLLPLPLWMRSALGAAPEQSLRFALVPAWLPLSFNAGSTLAALRLLAAAAVLFIAVLVTVTPRSAVVAAAWLVSAAGVIAAASIWSFLEPGAVFASISGVGTERARGPFVNPDHFGAWLAALIPLAAAGILTPRSYRPPGMRSYRLASAATLPILAAALGLTFSRGALLAAGCGLAYFALGVLGRGRSRRYGGAGIGVAVLAYAAWAAGAALAARFAILWHDPLGDMRFAFWRAAVDASLRAPILGSGLGTFLEAARSFLDSSVPSRSMVDYAHNELLQLTAEAGTVGLLIALAGFVTWLRLLRQARGAGEIGEGNLLSRGAEAGVITLLIAALFDFAIRLPAVGSLAAVLAALALAAERGRLTPRPIARPTAMALVVVTMAAAAGVIPGVLSAYRATRLTAEVTSASSTDRTQVIEALKRAVELQPRRGEYHYHLARELAEDGYRAWTQAMDLAGTAIGDDELRGRLVQSLYVRAADSYLDAIAADRTNPSYRRDLGWVMSNLATLEEVFATTPFTPEVLLDQLPQQVEPSMMALGLYRDAVDLEPRNAHLHYTLGLWALQQLGAQGNSGLGLARSDRAPVEEIGVVALKRAVALDAALLPETVEAAMGRGAVYEDVRALVPEQELALWRLARVLEKRGHTDWVDRLVSDIVVQPSGPSAQSAAEEVAASVAKRFDAAGARRILAQMHDAMPLSNRITGALAGVDWRLGAYAEARREFAEAIAGLPPSAERVALERDEGLMLIDAGDLVAAQEHFARLLTLRPADPWVQLGSGMVLDRQDLWLDASQAYQRARILAGRDDGIYFRLGLVYYQRGLYYQAASVWQAGVGVYPDGPEMRLWLARAYAKNANYSAAVQQCREALRLRPGYGEAQRELDSLLAGEAE